MDTWRLGSRQHPVAASTASGVQTPPAESAARCLFSIAVAQTPRAVTVIESAAVERIDGTPAADTVDAIATVVRNNASMTRRREPCVIIIPRGTL